MTPTTEFQKARQLKYRIAQRIIHPDWRYQQKEWRGTICTWLARHDNLPAPGVLIKTNPKLLRKL